MRSYLTNLTQSVLNFIDWHLTSSRVTGPSTRGNQPKTKLNPQTLLRFMLGQIYLGPRLLKYVLCYQGKSETENTCWQGHVRASAHEVVVSQGEMLSILCRFVLVFCLYGLRQTRASGKGLEGSESGSGSTCREKENHQKSRIRKGILLLPNSSSHPWSRLPVKADTPVAFLGSWR